MIHRIIGGLIGLVFMLGIPVLAVLFIIFANTPFANYGWVEWVITSVIFGFGLACAVFLWRVGLIVLKASMKGEGIDEKEAN